MPPNRSNVLPFRRQPAAEPPPVMTPLKAAPIVVVGVLFDAARFMFEMFWFFGPALAAAYCTGKVSGVVGTTVAGSVCSTVAAAGGAAAAFALTPFGIVMAMATAIAGGLTIFLLLFLFNRRILKENFLWLFGGFLVSEVPILGAFPALTSVLIRMYRVQIRTEKAARAAFDKEQAAQQAQERQRQAAEFAQIQALGQIRAAGQVAANDAALAQTVAANEEIHGQEKMAA